MGDADALPVEEAATVRPGDEVPEEAPGGDLQRAQVRRRALVHGVGLAVAGQRGDAVLPRGALVPLAEVGEGHDREHLDVDGQVLAGRPLLVLRDDAVGPVDRLDVAPVHREAALLPQLGEDRLDVLHRVALVVAGSEGADGAEVGHADPEGDRVVPHPGGRRRHCAAAARSSRTAAWRPARCRSRIGSRRPGALGDRLAVRAPSAGCGAPSPGCAPEDCAPPAGRADASPPPPTPTVVVEPSGATATTSAMPRANATSGPGPAKAGQRRPARRAAVRRSPGSRISRRGAARSASRRANTGRRPSSGAAATSGCRRGARG